MSTHIEIPLFADGSVMTYSACRWLLNQFNVRWRRDGDWFKVWQGDDDFNLPYMTAQAESTYERPKLGELYVDEGVHSDCVDTTSAKNEPTSMFVRGYAPAHAEVVDYTSVLGFLVRIATPDEKPTPTDLIGHGSRTRHYQAEYIRILDGKSLKRGYDDAVITFKRIPPYWEK